MISVAFGITQQDAYEVQYGNITIVEIDKVFPSELLVAQIGMAIAAGYVRPRWASVVGTSPAQEVGTSRRVVTLPGRGRMEIEGDGS